MTGLIEIGEQLKNSRIFWKSDINNMNVSIDKIQLCPLQVNLELQLNSS
jgi:hypothetical protein